MIVKALETVEEMDGKAHVHCQAWKEAYVGLVDQAFLDGRTLEMSRRSTQRAFELGISTWIAKDGDTVIGFIDYGPYRWDDLTAAGEVYAVYVLKEYYGTGVGSALMGKALEALREYQQIALWVLAGNQRAIRFYSRFGYRLDGKEQVLTLGTPVKDVRMVLKR